MNESAQAGYERAYDLMRQIWEYWLPADRKWFVSADASTMHHDLGRHLRNHAQLWEVVWTPYLIDGVDHSHDHPDAISARVIRQFQENKRREQQ